MARPGRATLLGLWCAPCAGSGSWAGSRLRSSLRGCPRCAGRQAIVVTGGGVEVYPRSVDQVVAHAQVPVGMLS